MRPPVAARPNPTAKLALRGDAQVPPGPSGSVSPLELAWSVHPEIAGWEGVGGASATTTGIRAPNLVLRENVLRPGATYTFRLQAS